ncbi:hypothetical protein L0F63_006682 [Massospora cicadina]|nr:hypothetical protein L0F63_006682 [Massospora cicadina]
MIEDNERHHSDLDLAEEIMTKFYNICLQFYQKCKEDLMSKLMQEHDEEIRVLCLWEKMIEENQLSFSQSLTKGTSCSKKLGQRVALITKVKNDSKETKPKDLSCSDSASK